MCAIALLLSIMSRKKPDRIPRSGAIGVKMQITAAITASVSHPYQWGCMDSST